MTRSEARKAPITKSIVDAAGIEARDYVIWDDGGSDTVKGFGLKVTPAGSKVYLYQYRIAAPGRGNQTPARKYTIGRHGEFTPDQARKRAKELRNLVERGIDPREQKEEARQAKEEAKRLAAEKARIDSDLVFEKLAERWLEQYEAERRPRSYQQAKSAIMAHLMPTKDGEPIKGRRTLHGKPLPSITRADLQAIVDGIPARQRATRRTVFTYASVLFGWAVKRGYISTSPLAAAEKPPVAKSRDRVLEDCELVEVWTATAKLAGPWGAFYRLAILTGQRREEVASLRWAELDRAKAVWTIPADRAKNGVAHIVPLSDGVVAELDLLAGMAGVDQAKRKWPGGGYVLTTTGKAAISGFSKAKTAIDAALLDLRQQAAEAGTEVYAMPAWRVHDLRRTLATGFQRLGVRFEVTEAVLNHVSGAKGGVAGIYQRHDWLAEKTEALALWAAEVAVLIAGHRRDAFKGTDDKADPKKWLTFIRRCAENGGRPIERDQGENVIPMRTKA